MPLPYSSLPPSLTPNYHSPLLLSQDTMHDVEIPANVSSHSIHIEREYDQYLFGISSEQLVTLPRGRTIISSSGIHWSKCTHILNKGLPLHVVCVCVCEIIRIMYAAVTLLLINTTFTHRYKESG